jgi:hypothetical protein
MKEPVKPSVDSVFDGTVFDDTFGVRIVTTHRTTRIFNFWEREEEK